MNIYMLTNVYMYMYAHTHTHMYMTDADLVVHTAGPFQGAQPQVLSQHTSAYVSIRKHT